MCKPGVRGGQKRGQIPWDWSYTTTWMLGIKLLEEGESPRNSERSDRLYLPQRQGFQKSGLVQGAHLKVGSKGDFSWAGGHPQIYYLALFLKSLHKAFHACFQELHKSAFCLKQCV